MNLPNKIKEIIGHKSYSIDTIGMSNSQVICFEDFEELKIVPDWDKIKYYILLDELF